MDPTQLASSSDADAEKEVGVEAAGESAPGELTLRPRTAQFVIFATVVFVLGMTVLIWLRWSSVSLPTSNIIPRGDPSLEGAVATVRHEGQLVASVTLTRENGYTSPIWVTPGAYELSVSEHGHTFAQGIIVVGPMRSATIPLRLPTTWPTSQATRPATAPD